MSQIAKRTNGSTPPTVPTQFVADDGTIAIAVAGVMNLFSRETSDNNINGIQTTVDPDGSNNIYIELTNRVSGDVQTVGAVTADVITFTTPDIMGIYNIEIDVILVDSTAPSSIIGGAFEVDATVAADGMGGLAVTGTAVRSYNGDSSYTVANIDVTFSGLDIIVQVTGIGGATARWTGLLTYVFGGP